MDFIISACHRKPDEQLHRLGRILDACRTPPGSPAGGRRFSGFRLRDRRLAGGILRFPQRDFGAGWLLTQRVRAFPAEGQPP